jgi:hypothetical protein
VINAMEKLSCEYGELIPSVEEMLNKYKASKFADIRQRCNEFLKLMNIQTLKEVYPKPSKKNSIKVIHLNFQFLKRHKD